MKERWKDINELPGYQVSSFGHVRSFKKSVGSGWIICDKPQRILKPSVGQYKSVNLTHENIQNQRKVHSLVIQAFLGPCPDGNEVCHNDGNPHNNCIDNLRYDTHEANMREAVLHGSYRFTVSQVLIMRTLRSNGAPAALLSRLFKVDRRGIHRVCSGRNYKVVGGPFTRKPAGLSNSKITMEDANDIRHIYTQGGTTMQAIGAQFGVSVSTVSRIVNYKRWA